ncbi:Predicted flavoprotein CzcO associated with the cation diffusion facilitator CzcD [Enhydrobacter aerosaccus]|uniref:Predicted flavoprotein CzcO associated with the cation diffusion facilitator CzcD n=1 Tax=Enhydrobacter aerosaccus TaxID=225324 RepID=A0A1T4NSK6_9HYPH|nr:NAD(P)/FAD-dependent oxidoreductase [Enhydrobacter aerosaccus]SJZ82243.1 Predicted flavoprotein CzcO associated with the cation diffusion facilitator CzcD [Enhydrobacter aerosaccus]
MIDATTSGAAGLAILEAQAHRELDLTAHPRADWMVPRLYRGKPALDVLIVGAGQCGMATAFGLMRDRVRNILLIDRAPEGKEGPWSTFARMPTLRSAKDQTGPDLGVASLTFQAWYEAQYGADAFARLHLIPTGQWHTYLLWIRRVLALPIRNEVALTAIAPGQLDDGGRCLLATLSTGEVLATRKLVLATGQDGTGEWWMPDFIRALPADRRAHTCENIDFERLRGRTVAVLGAGASAMDNAAVALEHGADVHLFCRRETPSVIQPYRWLTFAGFLRHMSEMPDEWRWRIMGHIMRTRESFPGDTYRRVMAFPDFRMHVGRNWTDARLANGRVRIETTSEPFDADYVICGTGIRQNLKARPELANIADHVALWGDRYAPPPGEEDPLLAASPYLGPDYAFLEKTPGTTPWLADIHLFGIGTTLSFGPSGSSINAMTIAVPKLVAGLTRGLFQADLERHWASLLAYDIKQVELDWQSGQMQADGGFPG